MIADNTVHSLLSMWNRHAYAAVVVGDVCTECDSNMSASDPLLELEIKNPKHAP
jgi:hypothetical protein